MKSLSDLAAPAAITRKLLESDVQRKCVDWAKRRGYWARKFSSPSQRSVPDYLFGRQRPFDAIPPGVNHGKLAKIKFSCEFKAPGKTSTAAQIEEQEAMRLAGWFVFECDDFEKFKATVIAYEKECV